MCRFRLKRPSQPTSILALALALGIWLLSLGTAAVHAAPAALQEVPPPGAAQQLALALAQRQPNLELISPKDDSLLPDGSWNLTLELRDWPLGESQELGPGAHLVVQVDDQAPLRIFEKPINSERLVIAMPPLTPGSHRFLAYAALPWGEAVNSKQARLEWRLHRAAANPGSLPDRDAPQLVAVPAPQLAAAAPIPINWLLLNAPLQHLKANDERWRLRLSLDGQSVVLDRREALWLENPGSGSHVLQLELLDPLGQPLGAPFNSLVRELVVPQRSAGTPGMLRPSLTAAELAALLDPSQAKAAEAPEPEPEPQPLPEPEPEPEPALEPEPVIESTGAASS